VLVGLVCAPTLGAVAYATLATFGMRSGEAVPAWWFGMTVSATLFAGVMAASFIGTLVPLVCRTLGVDPAIASGPFVTTLADIVSQLLYLALATWLLLA
jgi:magnesium transporter